MGEWKVILGSEKRKVVNPREKDESKKTRTEEIFHIITNDPYQLVLGEWVKDENGNLEIDDVKYSRFGSSVSYHQDYGSAVYKLLQNKKLKPIKDIKTPEDVVDFYTELNKEGKKLYRIDK